MYCRRNQMIAMMDGHCSVSLIKLNLDEVDKAQQAQEADVQMDSDDVDIDELEDCVSDKPNEESNQK